MADNTHEQEPSVGSVNDFAFALELDPAKPETLNAYTEALSSQNILRSIRRHEQECEPQNAQTSFPIS